MPKCKIMKIIVGLASEKGEPGKKKCEGGVRTFYIYIQEMYWLVYLLTDFLHFISEGVGGAEILFLRSKGFLEVKEMDKYESDVGACAACGWGN